jgi:hypothetical protein
MSADVTPRIVFFFFQILCIVKRPTKISMYAGSQFHSVIYKPDDGPEALNMQPPLRWVHTVTLPRTVTPYRDSVEGTRDHVTYQKLDTR